MPKSPNQKLKLLYLMKILLEYTDDDHGITMGEILQHLKAYDISAERKSIYDDLNCLEHYGLDIIRYQANNNSYYQVGSRPFELAELKLLVDAVQSSNFITTKKSQGLIEKIGGLTSKYEASQLHRQMYSSDRLKAGNENIYINVDAIHSAIAKDRQIRFHYFQWNEKKERVFKRDGDYYVVSPMGLLWDNKNYYLVAYNEEQQLRHFRVDKMLHIEDTDESRLHTAETEHFDIITYHDKMFGMYGGEEASVGIRCKKEKVGLLIDQFGQDIKFLNVDDECVETRVSVAVSEQFIHWILSLGNDVVVISPEDVVKRIQEEILRLQHLYCN